MLRLHLLFAALILSCATSILGAQQPANNPQALLLDHVFHADSDQVTIELRRSVVYRVELNGWGSLLVESHRSARSAFIVPIGDTTSAARRFELFAFVDGPHIVRIVDIPTADSASLRIYRDSAETERIAVKNDRAATLGISLAGGLHSGYRVDPSGGDNPRAGGDLEGCLLLETGDRLGTCLGLTAQSFPDAHYTGHWLFLEERVRLLSRQWLGTRASDLGAMVRYSRGISIGPRLLNPGLLGFGVSLTQRFSGGGRRRGWRAQLVWHHSQLINAPETEFIDVDRVTLGLIWVP